MKEFMKMSLVMAGVVALFFLGQIVSVYGLTDEERLQLLEDKFLKGEVSEDIYRKLLKKYEEKTGKGETKPQAPKEAEPQVKKASKDLIINGGFEEEDEAGLGVAAGWKPRYMRKWIVLDDMVKHSGEKSVKFGMPEGGSSGTVECWRQKPKVQGGKPYRIKFWCKSENFQAKDCSFNNIVFLDGEGKNLKQHWIGVHKMRGSQDWTKFELNAPAPAGAVEAQLSLGVYFYQASGTLWYDDVSIIPLF